MNQKEMIFKAAQKIISDIFCVPKETITLNTNLMEDFGWDSLDRADIMIKLEGEFNYTLSNDEEDNAYGVIWESPTVQTIVDIVSEKLDKTNQEAVGATQKITNAKISGFNLSNILFLKNKKCKMNEIFEKICDILCKELGVSRKEIKFETNLVDDLGADSLDRIQIIMDAERAFNCELDTTEENYISNAPTVTEIMKVIIKCKDNPKYRLFTPEQLKNSSANAEKTPISCETQKVETPKIETKNPEPAKDTKSDVFEKIMNIRNKFKNKIFNRNMRK